MKLIYQILWEIRQVTAKPLTNPEHALLIAGFYERIVLNGRSMSEAELQAALDWICQVEVS